MPNKYVPDDLTIMESACVNWVLSAIKSDIQRGISAEQAIGQALVEANQTSHSKNQTQSPSGRPR